MLFKPELNETAKAAGRSVIRSVLRRSVSLLITLLILGGLGYIGWLAWQQKQASNRGAGARPDLPVPVLAATPRIQDVPVYAGEPVAHDASVLKSRMRAPEVKVLVELGLGDGSTVA